MSSGATDESLRNELSNVPLGDLLKLQEKLGTKKFNEAYASKPPSSGVTKKTYKRDNKNRPMEISSKRKPGKGASAVRFSTSKVSKVQDPRFDERAGEYKESLFRQSYGFVDSLRVKEKEKAQKQLLHERTAEGKEKLRREVEVAEQREKASEAQRKREAAGRALKKEDRTRVAEGKAPYYAKKSKVKEVALVEQFKELKKAGKLEQYLKKKRKKTASKDRKKIVKGNRHEGAS